MARASSRTHPNPPACRDVDDEVGRPANATIMSRAEWDEAVQRRSAFAVDVRSHPTLPLIGEAARASSR